MEDKSQSRLAVLIDADNAQSSIIAGLLDEIAQYGIASVKRIYGDWTDTRLKGWKTTLLEHGINPVQQFAYTTGKNATDSALIIDAKINAQTTTGVDQMADVAPRDPYSVSTHFIVKLKGLRGVPVPASHAIIFKPFGINKFKLFSKARHQLRRDIFES